MKRLLIAGGIAVVALVVGIAIAVAATNGGGYGSSAAPASSGSAKALVDANGQALYVNDQERSGMVLCNDACASIWVPVTAAEAPKAGSVTGMLGVVKRPDGSSQETLDGKPLYTFYADKPGQVSGNGLKDAFGSQRFSWHVVHANGSTSSSGGTSTNSGSYGY
jgi:predicted lipoprotein with Yx(FWY)xxD motif